MGLFGLPLFAAGASNYNPAVLSLTAWLRNYGGAGPWLGTASAGSSGSGSNDFDDFTDPAAGSSLNGYGTADFTTFETLTGEGTTDTYVSALAFSGWYLVNPDSVTNGYLFQSNTGSIELELTSSTIQLSVNSASATVSKAISSGAYSLVTFRYDATDLEVGVNEIPGASGGGSTTAYSSSVVDLTSAPTIGNNYNGRIAEVGIIDTALTDQNFTDIKSYINRRYGLSL